MIIEINDYIIFFSWFLQQSPEECDLSDPETWLVIIRYLKLISLFLSKFIGFEGLAPKVESLVQSSFSTIMIYKWQAKLEHFASRLWDKKKQSEQKRTSNCSINVTLPVVDVIPSLRGDSHPMQIFAFLTEPWNWLPISMRWQLFQQVCYKSQHISRISIGIIKLSRETGDYTCW